MFRLRARWPCLETMYKYKPKTRYLPWKYKQNYRKLYGLQISARQAAHHLPVRREPRHRVQVVAPQPGGVFMLLQYQLSCTQRAEVAVHHQVKSRIVVLYSDQKIVNLDINVQLLAYLAPQRLFAAFARLNLPTWKLPIVFVLSISSLRGQVGK